MAPFTAYDSTKAQPPSVPANNRPLTPAPDTGKPPATSDAIKHTQPYPTTPVAGDIFAELDSLTSNPNTNPIRARTKVPDTSSLPKRS